MIDAAKHENIETDHEYDGILEYDNRLPNWWLATLYGAILFSFGYWLYFHTFDIGLDQMGELAREQAAAERAAELRLAGVGALDDGTLLALAADEQAVRRGQEAYSQNCVACHGARGEGTVGPNLTDSHWVHGGQPTDIYRVVAEGSLEKGMPSWQPVLGPARVRDVTAFLLTLKGTNVPGKAPEGDLEEKPGALSAPGT